MGIIHLPASLQALAHPWVLGIAVVLYLLEFFADKIPYIDTIWDLVHKVVRPPAAALLAYAAVGGAGAEWRGGAALAVWLSWMASAHPVATTIVVCLLLALCAYLIYQLFRFARRGVRRRLDTYLR